MIFPMGMLPNFLHRLYRKLDKTISSRLFLDQWVILTSGPQSPDSLEWSAFSPLIPPPDRYWADPFVITRDGLHYVFIEEKLYRTKRGRIACLTLDASGSLLSNQMVLERAYHLSYPFLFEYGGQLYMLPESAQNRTLEAYRCTHFPDRWEFAQTLMQDVNVVDATLLEHDGKWWLFMNMKVGEGSSSLDRLFLYSADTPLATTWTPHPMNPVVDDIRRARPAGWIFSHQEKLMRPSQDSSVRYGYALNLNRIKKLSETEYEEVCEIRLEPPAGKHILATHTFNTSEQMTVIDAVIRRRK